MKDDKKKLITIEIDSVESIASSLLLAAAKLEAATEGVDALAITKELTKFNLIFTDMAKMNLDTYSLQLSLEIKKALRGASDDFDQLKYEIFDESLRELKRLNGAAHVSCASVSAADEKLSILASNLSIKIDELSKVISELSEIELIITSLKRVEKLQKNYSIKNTIVSSCFALMTGIGGMYIFLKMM